MGNTRAVERTEREREGERNRETTLIFIYLGAPAYSILTSMLASHLSFLSSFLPVCCPVYNTQTHMHTYIGT
jgi:hypothetical protein